MKKKGPNKGGTDKQRGETQTMKPILSIAPSKFPIKGLLHTQQTS
uniref:Uncharacterized protein n=1 Tax=Rhizophora mucronata TaxID=61149 RepID=A0A2P2QH39_RHIMU